MSAFSTIQRHKGLRLQFQRMQSVKGFVLPRHTKEDGINRLQQRFNGKLTVIKPKDGPHYVFTDDTRTAHMLEIFARYAKLPEVSHLTH